MKKMNLAPLAALALIACGGFTPMEGMWASTSVTVNSDGCGVFDEVEGIEVDMSLSDDESTMTFGLGEGLSVTCALENNAFDCTPLTDVQEIDGVDATINISQTITGSFEDEHNGMVNIAADITCEGADCEAVAAAAELTLPCTADADATIAHAM